MKDVEQICENKRCRGEAELRYLGKWLCQKCWLKLCQESDRVIDRGIENEG